jgi:acetoin utilization deacetylase AcuC-like enzyme
MPYTFPVVGRRALDLDRIDARLGRHSFDTATPLAEGTWEAAYWSAQTALEGLAAVLAGEQAAFALTRPPGHHAGADYMGGYSYLNHAAIAAEAALGAGQRRVAILDVDYHHGNGTQDIFHARGDVLYASIHADPATDYPFFWGHADERGGGPGAGATLNLPLPRGTGWAAYEPALGQALDWLDRREPELLILSYGADTYAGDPISHFELQTDDYTRMANCIASLGVPTLIVMEGGYALDALGANVAAFLGGFA